jgi:hypothetical protein
MPSISLTTSAAAVLLAAAGACAQVEYELFVVESLSPGYGLSETYILDINLHGIACGWTTLRRQTPQGTQIGYSGVLWEAPATRTPINVSMAGGINNSGLVVGNWGALDTITGTYTTQFPVLPYPTTYYGPNFSAVNDAGVAVGYIAITSGSNSNGTLQIPYLWNSANNTARTLDVPGAKGAWRINNAGQIVGWRGGNSMYLWYHYDLATEQYVMMEDLFPPNPSGGKTTAADVSHSGIVVGERTEGVTTYGYTWVPGQAPQVLPLPSIPGYSATYLSPRSVNSSGVVVGVMLRESPFGQRPFVYDPVNGIRDLNDLVGPLPPGFHMRSVSRINDNGWIIGYGPGGNEYMKGFVLRPIQTSAPCWPNCDGSTVPPVLNVEDFSCFINEFAQAQGLPHAQQLTHYANCDQSTTAPALNVEDFSCFINRFAQGCD